MFLIRIWLCFLLLQPVFAAQKVNVNTADAAQLASALSGVGEKKAQLIIAWRKENGPFRSLDDLGKIKGFGPKLIERNKDIIVFSSSALDQDRSRGKSSTGAALSWPSGGYVAP
ncbi:MAG: ComEA family DNA-binding protein [Gammaproteobacteria bacterium]|nr:ComEA family DNA-binding protein [Gammaproteobacteria bacterium]